jgi:ribosome maturation factor RimP
LSLSIFERLNYQIQRLIEELGIEKGSYELVLSSPGIERSLKTNRHFELALNQEIKIKLTTPHEGVYTFIGILTQVNSNDIKILIDNKSIDFELVNIKKANISFDKFKVKVNS